MKKKDEIKIIECKLITLKIARLLMEGYDIVYIMEEVQYLYDVLESMGEKKP